MSDWGDYNSDPIGDIHRMRRLMELQADRAFSGKPERWQLETEWRQKYAPFGFLGYRECISFDQMARAPEFVPDLFRLTIERLHYALKKQFLKTGTATPYDEGKAFTRITVYPKYLGESLDHLDLMNVRLGIELEIRWPMTSQAEFEACAFHSAQP